MRLAPWVVGSWPVKVTREDDGRKLIYLNTIGHKVILEPIEGVQVLVTCDDGQRKEQHVLPPEMAEEFALRWLVLRSQFTVGRN